MVLELASLEKKKKERRKKMTIFDFFKIRLLSFCSCTAELKSEDINYLYSGGSGLSEDTHFVG